MGWTDFRFCYFKIKWLSLSVCDRQAFSSYLRGDPPQHPWLIYVAQTDDHNGGEGRNLNIPLEVLIWKRWGSVWEEKISQASGPWPTAKSHLSVKEKSQWVISMVDVWNDQCVSLYQQACLASMEERSEMPLFFTISFSFPFYFPLNHCSNTSLSLKVL